MSLYLHVVLRLLGCLRKQYPFSFFACTVQTSPFRLCSVDAFCTFILFPKVWVAKFFKTVSQSVDSFEEYSARICHRQVAGADLRCGQETFQTICRVWPDNVLARLMWPTSTAAIRAKWPKKSVSEYSPTRWMTVRAHSHVCPHFYLFVISLVHVTGKM